MFGLPRCVRQLIAVSAGAVCCFGGCAVGVSAQSPNSLAFQHARHLQRGINTSDWFAQQPGNYGVERLRSFTTAEDLTLIHQLGFDHIRLSIDADPLVAWQRGQGDGTAFMGELDRVVQTANADGLAVIVDIHPESKYKATLLQGSEGVGRFAALWRSLAEHFKGTDPNLVFFEIMNEPEQSDSYRWQGIEGVVAQAIRGVAPNHTIIAAGAHYSGLDDLLVLEPIADPNVIYTFHDYEPFTFTHQGATWTDPREIPLRGVPYPSTPDNVVANEAQEPSIYGQYYVEEYGLARWDAERVDRTIAFAEKWGELHHVPVYCGEFGVHRPYAPPASRAQWLHDMRVTLEKHKIGWAMWDYQDNFGLVTKANGVATPDPQLVEALGLKTAK